MRHIDVDITLYAKCIICILFWGNVQIIAAIGITAVGLIVIVVAVTLAMLVAVLLAMLLVEVA